MKKNNNIEIQYNAASLSETVTTGVANNKTGLCVHNDHHPSDVSQNVPFSLLKKEFDIY